MGKAHEASGSATGKCKQSGVSSLLLLWPRALPFMGVHRTVTSAITQEAVRNAVLGLPAPTGAEWAS
jgi:hypothetical protein